MLRGLRRIAKRSTSGNWVLVSMLGTPCGRMRRRSPAGCSRDRSTRAVIVSRPRMSWNLKRGRQYAARTRCVRLQRPPIEQEGKSLILGFGEGESRVEWRVVTGPCMPHGGRPGRMAAAFLERCGFGEPIGLSEPATWEMGDASIPHELSAQWIAIYWTYGQNLLPNCAQQFIVFQSRSPQGLLPGHHRSRSFYVATATPVRSPTTVLIRGNTNFAGRVDTPPYDVTGILRRRNSTRLQIKLGNGSYTRSRGPGPD